MCVTNPWDNLEVTSDLGFLCSASSYWLSVFEVKGLWHNSIRPSQWQLCTCTASQMAAYPQWMPGNGKAYVGDYTAW